MARKASWMGRIPEILETLDQSRQQNFSRRDVEELFQIGRSQAQSLMKQLGATPLTDAAGSGSSVQALVIPKAVLVVWLVRGNGSLEAIRERSRRQEMQARVAKAREEAQLRSREIPAAKRSDPHKGLDDLPNVAIADGELRIRFTGSEDLLRTLWEVSKAIANDWPRFQELTAA